MAGKFKENISFEFARPKKIQSKELLFINELDKI